MSLPVNWLARTLITYQNNASMCMINHNTYDKWSLYHESYDTYYITHRSDDEPHIARWKDKRTG